MTNKLKELNKYFQAGTAEGDDSFLKNVFVPSEEYIDIITIPIGGPRILLGNKGSGKSALLRYFRSQMKEIDVPSIFIRPKDISIEIGKDHSLGSQTRSCEVAILKGIASKIGSGINGLVLNENDKKLLEIAKKEAGKEDDVIEKLAQILSPLGKKLSGIDFSKMNIGKSDVGISGIKRAIESNLDRSERCLYVLIDDTDQIASPSESEHLNRIWAFFLAARSIMEDCSNIKFIITLRDEVWRRLKRDQSGQRDQVDHFRNLVHKVNVKEDEIKSIIKRRLELVLEKCTSDATLNPYTYFFENSHVQIPTTNEEFRYWSDFIVKRSRERPRDSIQLVHKLAEFALKNSCQKIHSEHVNKVMPTYSEERVDDLKRECDQECPQIKDVIRAFSDLNYEQGAFTLHPQQAAEFLGSLPSRFSINLFGKALKNSDSDDVFELWRFLHEIGFINARISDSRMDKGYRHITSEDDPDLVSPSRWNDMQSLTWEIHPSYRDYLIKIQSEKEFSFGLPTKKSKTRKRKR